MSFIRESTRVFAYRIVLVAVIVVTDIALARLLGPTVKGYVTILTIVPVMVAVLSAGGLDFALNHLTHHDRDRAFALFSAAALVGMSTALVVALLLAADVGALRTLLFGSLPGEYSGAELVALCIIPAEVAFVLTGMLAMSTGRPVLFAQMRIARRSVILIVVCSGILLYAVDKPAVVFSVTGGTVCGIVGAVLIALRAMHYDWSRPYRRLKELLSQAGSAYGARVAERLQTRVDVVFLGILGSARHVGVYSVATGIAEAVFFASNSIATVLFSRGAKHDALLHRQVFRFMVPLSILLAAVVGIAGAVAIPAVWGARFANGVYLLLMLLPGVVAIALSQTLTPSLVQAGRSGVVSLAYASGLGVNVVLNLVLIRQYGAFGSAIAKTMSDVVTLGVMMVWIIAREDVSLGELTLLTRGDRAQLTRFVVDKLRWTSK